MRVVGRRTSAAAVAGLTAVALAACGSSGGSSASSSGSASGGSPYKIGVLVSQTGAASQLGVGELRGAQLAADHLNAAGGVDGHKVQIVALDDQTQPAQDVQQARQLVSQQVAAIVGPSVVAGCNAVSPLVASRGPVDYCLSPGISPSGNVWSASVKTDDLAERLLSYWKDKGITKIGLISTTDASGKDGARAVNAAAKKAGVDVVSSADYDPTAVSATSQLQQVMSGNPQALVVWSTGTPAGVALKGIQQLGINLPVGTTDGNLSNTFLQRIADYTPQQLLIPATRDFWWQTLPKNDPGYALEQDYHQKYQQKYNETPDFGPGVGYDAVLLVGQALKKAGSSDATKVASALEQVDGFTGVVGTYHMSANDHRGLGLADVSIVQAKNGTFAYAGK